MSDDQARMMVYYDIRHDSYFVRLDVAKRGYLADDRRRSLWVCSPPISIPALHLPGGEQKARAKISNVVSQLEVEMAKHMKKNSVRLADVIVPDAPAGFTMPEWAKIGRPIRIAL